MPRRTSIARKTKYETVPANRTTARFSAKLMKDGKQNLAERILRQALARAEAQAQPARPRGPRGGAAQRDARSSRSSRAASAARPTRSRSRSAATAACRSASAGSSRRPASATARA